MAIIGGVKHRAMSNLSNEVRLELDSANLDSDTVVGIKLDKSKAFDRIIPQFAACLFVAFGIPKHVASEFIRMYQGMRKHLAFRSWTSPVPVTRANGVAQGCSFSILAMNVYNKVWYHLIKNLQGISVRAYVVDVYLWRRVIDLHHLKTAVQLTGVWDALVGQNSMLVSPHCGPTIPMAESKHKPFLLIWQLSPNLKFWELAFTLQPNHHLVFLRSH